MILLNNYKEMYFNTVLRNIKHEEKNIKFQKHIQNLLIAFIIYLLLVISIYIMFNNIIIPIVISLLYIYSLFYLLSYPKRYLIYEKKVILTEFPMFISNFCNFHYTNRNLLQTLIETYNYTGNIIIRRKIHSLIMNLSNVSNISIEKKISIRNATILVLTEFGEELNNESVDFFIESYLILLDKGYDKSFIKNIKSSINMDQEYIIKSKMSSKIGVIQSSTIQVYGIILIMMVGGAVLYMNNIFEKGF